MVSYDEDGHVERDEGDRCDDCAAPYCRGQCAPSFDDLVSGSEPLPEGQAAIGEAVGHAPCSPACCATCSGKSIVWRRVTGSDGEGEWDFWPCGDCRVEVAR